MGSSDSSASSSAPEPVPRSAILSGGGARSRPIECVERGFDHGLGLRPRHQGRGIELKSRPQNSLTPMMRATGSRASRRAAKTRDRIGLGGGEDARGLRGERRVVEAERVRHQEARVELGRRKTVAAKRSAPASGARSQSRGMDRAWQPRSLQRALRGQQGGLMLGDERVDDLAQRLAFDDLRQLVERQIDAVVGHAALRKVVGPDALGPVAGADLAAPLGGARGVVLLALERRRAWCAAPPSPWRGCGAASGPPA